ncbi:MAG: hypothetical protein ACRDHG_10705 [Anaerolineales bacterium]
MALGPGFAAQGNTFIPNWDASGRLMVAYSRNPARFPIAQYAQMVESPRTVGFWLKITAQEAARVVTVQDYEWPDGQNRPMRTGLESFNFNEFRTHRFDYGFTIGNKASEQADWPIVEAHSQIHAAKCMTARTIRAMTVLLTTTNWATAADPDMGGPHFDTATALGGGFWSVGTSLDPNIKQTLDNVAVQINRDTLGVINGDPQNLMLVVNPTGARTMAESPEIHDYIKGSYWAQQELLQGLHPNNKYGLPSSIYGYNILVENTIKVTSRKGATLVKGHALTDTNAIVLSRPGGIEGAYGTPSFSTMTIFWYRDEMSLERFDDPKNRLTEAHVVEDTAEILTAPATGFLITAIHA